MGKNLKQMLADDFNMYPILEIYVGLIQVHRAFNIWRSWGIFISTHKRNTYSNERRWNKRCMVEWLWFVHTCRHMYMFVFSHQFLNEDCYLGMPISVGNFRQKFLLLIIYLIKSMPMILASSVWRFVKVGLTLWQMLQKNE